MTVEWKAQCIDNKLEFVDDNLDDNQVSQVVNNFPGAFSSWQIDFYLLVAEEHL